jgi:hypothetical protein
MFGLVCLYFLIELEVSNAIIGLEGIIFSPTIFSQHHLAPTGKPDTLGLQL